MTSAPDTPVELSELLCFDLYAASRVMTARYRPLLEPLGLTYPQYLVMVVLWKQRACPIKVLAEALRLDYGTLTPLLRRLEDTGFLTRQRCGPDERTVTIALTDPGVDLQRRAGHIPAAICAAVGLDADAAGQLQRTLRTLTAHLTADATVTPVGAPTGAR